LGLCLLRQIDQHGHHGGTHGVKDNRVRIAKRESLICPEAELETAVVYKT
jgi:hypothetical protein